MGNRIFGIVLVAAAVGVVVYLVNVVANKNSSDFIGPSSNPYVIGPTSTPPTE